MAPISIGEIHVPGNTGLAAARCLTLTSPLRHDGALELFFAMFAADAQRKILERLADRLGEELRPVFFQKGDPEVRFEAALKQANKTILAFLYEHGLSLPGIKLRGAAAALAGGKLFVASRGAMRGLLYVPREGALAPYALFSETPDKPSEPKFFTSLQAGAFPGGGRLILATSELFHVLDDAYARDLLGHADFAKASRDVKSALRSSSKPVSILSLSSLPAEGGAAELNPREAAGRRAAASGTSVPAPAAPMIAPDVGELAAQGLRTGSRLAARGTVLLGSFLWTLLKHAARIPFKVPGLIAALTNRERRQRLFSACAKAPDRGLAALVQRLNALPGRGRTHLFVLIALGAVLAHGILFSIRYEARAQALKAYEAQLAGLHQLEADFAASMIYDNENRSRELLSGMEDIWNALPETVESQKRAKAEARDILDRAREQLRRLVVVERPEPFATLGAEGAEAISWFSGKLYAFSGASGRVRTFSETGAEAEVREVASLSSGIVSAAPARTGFLLQSASGTVVYWNPENGEETSYAAADVADAPMLFYQGRLYVAGADGTVTRRAVTASALGASSDVLRGAPASPSSLAADGAVYLLYKDGSTRKYLRGASVQSYAASAIDPAPTDATDLWASANSDKIVFIDRGGDRAFTADKTTGRLVAQMTAPEFKNLRAATVDEGGRAAYLLAGSGTIYKVPLK